jgi:hypothetical protein
MRIPNVLIMNAPNDYGVPTGYKVARPNVLMLNEPAEAEDHIQGTTVAERE